MEAWSSPVRRPAFSYTAIEKAHKDTLTPSLSKRQTRYSASINWSTWCLFKPQLSAKNILMAIVAHGTSQMKTLFNLWVTPTFSRLSSERLRRWTAEQKSSLFAVLALAGISLCFYSKHVFGGVFCLDKPAPEELVSTIQSGEGSAIFPYFEAKKNMFICMT